MSKNLIDSNNYGFDSAVAKEVFTAVNQPTGANANSLRTAGVYTVIGGLNFAVSNATGALFVIENSALIYQVHINGDGHVYTRVYESGSWTNWSA